MRRGRATIVLATAAAVAIGLPAAGEAAPAAPAAKRPAKRPKPVVLPRGTSVVAQAKGRTIAVYARRGAKRPLRVYHRPRGSRTPLVFLVDWKTRRWTWPAWVKVKLPSRPNGSTAWVRSSSVRYLRNAYRIRVDLQTNELTVWRNESLRVIAPVARGKAATPTPTGRYFLSTLLKPRNPRGAYGPYAFGLSAHSRVLTRFAGGPGQIGLHGTNRPALISQNVSHGCIRVHNDVIRRLARAVPLGTPIDVVPRLRPRGHGSFVAA